MTGMKKRIIFCIVLLVALTTFVSIFSGCTELEKIPKLELEENIYIYDQGSILDDSIEQELNEMLVELNSKTRTKFIVVTVESLLSRSVESYSDILFATVGNDDNVLLLISRSDEKVRLQVGESLVGSLGNKKCGYILDDFFVPYRENDEYTEATEQTVHAVLKVLCERYDTSITGLDTESITVREPEPLTPLQIFLIVIVVIILIIIEYITGKINGGGFGHGFVSECISEMDFDDFVGGGGASR